MLFDLVESYINLRFIAYSMLFSENNSINRMRSTIIENDEFFYSLSNLDLNYNELIKLLINDNLDENDYNSIEAIYFEDKKNYKVELLNKEPTELLNIENKIAIVYYILHHNEKIFEWMNSGKCNYLVSGFEIGEIEIQRFKDFNIKELLDYAEKYYSKRPLHKPGNEIKESIYSKMVKLCMFQVPQYFNHHVLIINEFLSKLMIEKNSAYTSRNYNLVNALESLVQSPKPSDLYTYYINLSEKPYITAITVINFFNRRYRKYKIRYSYDKFYQFYNEFGIQNLVFSESFQNQLFGNQRKEKKIISLSCFDFNLSECVLISENMLRIWSDCISILMDVELHQMMKKILNYKNTPNENRIKNQWIIYKCLIIQ